MQAAKIAMKDDRPILLDYYTDSANGRAFVGEDAETKEKVLVKSREEFTSNVTSFTSRPMISLFLLRIPSTSSIQRFRSVVLI